ncbi:MAG: hypothetical protein C5B57_01090 [Blastocatellia bacterium]|nr:MAG: hypothetical protein C5B57_01090 [Blastocatellia bacterium]
MSEHDPTMVSAATEALFDIGREWSLEEVAAIAQPVEVETPMAGEAAGPIPKPIPIPPLPLPMRAVSGRYRSGSTPFELELRVDVDRTRPTRRVSGDFFQIAGGTKTYFGSFVVNSPNIIVAPTLVTIEGLGLYTFAAGAPRIRVTIPRVRILQPPAPASVAFFTLSGQPGATYLCNFESIYFRSVLLETDRVADVTTPVFASYNTGSLPSGGPARVLSVPTAYSEAGIDIQISPGSDVLPAIEEGVNNTWSDAELHASMVRHFSLWREEPQFRVWELVAQLHDLGPGLLGIMFDQQGRQRQGCAVFHAGLGGATPDQQRLQLYTYTHELGHCFNLLHSWQKSLATPPGVDRPAALSWMNYPWKFPGGPAAFWSAFPFQFDDGEIVHLRHAYRNNIIMGGANFAVGASLSRVEKFNVPVEDRSGLILTISAPGIFQLGEPVTITVRLTATDLRVETAHPYLNPEAGLLHIAIVKPGGEVVAYEPMIEHCVIGERLTLSGEQNSIQETVYIGYGRDGQYFRQAGLYEIRAVYEAIDGSQIVSNILRIRVRNPVSAEEEQLTDLLLGDEQGALFYLRGSDSEALSSGNRALETVLDQFAEHPLAAYVRLIKGMNAGRDFKIVSTEPEPKIEVRRADPAASVKLLSSVVKAPEQTRLDSQSLELAAMQLAAVQRKQGDDRGATATESSLKRRRGKAVRV